MIQKRLDNTYNTSFNEFCTHCPMKNAIKSAFWQRLKTHHETLAKTRMVELFESNPNRFEEFSIKSSGILLDFSRHLITQPTLKLLIELADAAKLQARFQALLTGESVNTTENRPALHTALRQLNDAPLCVNGQNIKPAVQHELNRVLTFAKAIHEGRFRGTTGQPITDVVNIGIGGSHLGPYLATTALKEYAKGSLRFHFLSSIDSAPLNDLITKIHPETTLFIVSSKSFSTLETLTNAHSLKAWLNEIGLSSAFPAQWVAITAYPEKAAAFGFPPDHIFETFEWVGGRYSVWSSIGLPLLLMLGSEGFLEFLEGAHSMDTHVQSAPYEKNMAIMLALLSFWHMHFDHSTAEAVAPYAKRLQALVPYLQQAAMESLGKSVNLQGEKVSTPIGPIIFGQEGSEGQHAYHQFLHQGNLCIPIDFILIARAHATHNERHHRILLASALSQTEALMRGLSVQEIQAKHPELTPEEAAHRALPGNRPSNILLLDELSPKTLGALLSLYEHKIFAASVLANINPFDQWGVELGKQLLPDILSTLETPLHQNEPDTLLTHLKKLRNS